MNVSNYTNDMINPLDPDILFDKLENINLPYIKLDPYKSSEISKIPLIGWYGRRTIGYVIILIIIILIIYLFFYKKQNETPSIGCINNGCKSTPCYGPECSGDNCTGIGCHAGSCYGEGCIGGTCSGTGCKGGDCYGSGCIVGKCQDPNCDPNKESQGLCKPNCSWGRAYNIPESMYLRPIKNILPSNTFFNQNLCIKPSYITENLIKDNKILYNFKVNGAHYYYGGYQSIDEINAKITQGTIITNIN